MKVRVILSVEIDEAAWEDIYGDCGESLRDEIRNYVLHNMRDSAAAEDGAILSVRLGR